MAIAINGVYIEYDALAAAGELFELLFGLPFANGFRRVYAKGKLVRAVIISGKDGYGIAFNFVEFAREISKVSGKYLEWHGLKTAV